MRHFRVILLCSLIFAGCSHPEPKESIDKGFSELSDVAPPKKPEVLSKDQVFYDSYMKQILKSHKATNANFRHQIFESQSLNCVNDKILVYFGKEINKSFSRVPDVSGRNRIGLDRRIYASSDVEYLIVAGSGTRALFDHRPKKGRKKIEPVIVVGCEDLKAFSAPIVREFAYLYLNDIADLNARKAAADGIHKQLLNK